jgi:hypothetical protein
MVYNDITAEFKRTGGSTESNDTVKHASRMTAECYSYHYVG